MRGWLGVHAAQVPSQALDACRMKVVVTTYITIHQVGGLQARRLAVLGNHPLCVCHSVALQRALALAFVNAATHRSQKALSSLH
jgi:hypothetical protein